MIRKSKSLNEFLSFNKQKQNKATILKKTDSNNIIMRVNILTEKELEMIKTCYQLEDNMRYCFYFRISLTDPENEILKYLKNW